VFLLLAVAQVAVAAPTVCDVRCSAPGITCFQSKINSEAITPALLDTLEKYPKCQDAVMSLHACKDDLKVETGCCTSQCMDALAKSSLFCLGKMYCGMDGLTGTDTFMSLLSSTVDRCGPGYALPQDCSAPSEVIENTMHAQERSLAGSYGGPPPAGSSAPTVAVSAAALLVGAAAAFVLA